MSSRRILRVPRLPTVVAWILSAGRVVALALIDLGYASVVEHGEKFGDATLAGVRAGGGEDYPLGGSGQTNEEGGGRFDGVSVVGPPLVVVEAEEEDGVVFQALAAVGGE